MYLDTKLHPINPIDSTARPFLRICGRLLRFLPFLFSIHSFLYFPLLAESYTSHRSLKVGIIISLYLHVCTCWYHSAESDSSCVL